MELKKEVKVKENRDIEARHFHQSLQKVFMNSYEKCQKETLKLMNQVNIK